MKSLLHRERENAPPITTLAHHTHTHTHTHTYTHTHTHTYTHTHTHTHTLTCMHHAHRRLPQRELVFLWLFET